jgi:hypothetical protein
VSARACSRQASLSCVGSDRHLSQIRSFSRQLLSNRPCERSTDLCHLILVDGFKGPVLPRRPTNKPQNNDCEPYVARLYFECRIYLMDAPAHPV